MAPARRKDRGPLYVAVDFGTSHVRAAVGGGTGRPLAIARSPLTYYQPEDGPDTALEFDPDSAWRVVTKAVRSAMRQSGATPGQVQGIGVTSQRLGLVLFDKSGDAIYAGPNRDIRAVFEGGEIDADAGNTIWQITGHGPGFLTAWAKLLWFKRNRPDLYDEVRTAAGIADWLAQRMTGVLLMESALGTESGLAMVATGHPAESLTSTVGVPEVDLPPTVPAGTTVGRLLSNAARSLGVRSGIPVVACGPDTQAGLLGLGVTNINDAGVVAGWSAAVQRITETPAFDDTLSMWTGRHVVPERWTIEGNAGEMGGAYEWLISMVCAGEDPARAMRRMDRQAMKEDAGARGAALYLGPSFVNISDVGLRTGGLLFPVPLAFEPPDRPSLVRAALESFAYAIRFNLERLATFGGPARGIAAGGGMVRSRTFREVLAATLGRPVAVGVSGEATVLGALSLTSASLEEQSLEDLAGSRVSELEIVEPALGDIGEYDQLYHEWRGRERRLLDIDL